MTNVQIIRSPSGDELVVIPRAVYEDLIDARAARDAQAALARGEEELLSEEELKEFLGSPTPLAFWLRKRRRRPDMLAQVLGMSSEDVSDIAEGRRRGGFKFYERAALALQVPLTAVLPPDEEN
jgi:transcriptional regulator of met regulon